MRFLMMIYFWIRINWLRMLSTHLRKFSYLLWHFSLNLLLWVSFFVQIPIFNFVLLWKFTWSRHETRWKIHRLSIVLHIHKIIITNDWKIGWKHSRVITWRQMIKIAHHHWIIHLPTHKKVFIHAKQIQMKTLKLFQSS